MSQQVFTNRYEIQHHLARGGMAEVYVAKDLLLDRPVALKVLFPELSADPAFVERFRREAQAAANLNHPNIVSVYDWGEEGSTYFIVMEYVDGPTLRDLIRTEGKLHPTRAADIGADIANALSFAHRNGVIHRDVKPGNVLITGTGQVKVTDFGIARAARDSAGENLTQTGTVMGTATYFSPEQAQGKAIDPRSDVYSLGVVLYEMLCGKAPFTGDNPVAIAYQHVQEAPVPPRQLNPDVPPELEAVVLRALAKDAATRYATAHDLRDDLLRFREGRGVAAATMAVPVAAGAGEATRLHGAAAEGTRVAPVVTGATAVAAPLPPASRRTGAYIALLLVLLAILGVLLFLLYRQFNATTGSAARVAVPSVITKPEADARQAIEGAGLKVDVQKSANDQVAAGLVFDQQPPGGEKVAKGSTVTIQVSAGAPTVAVPSVVGRQLDDARDVLTARGFNIGEVRQQPDDRAPVNEVLSQSPAAGSMQAKGSTITLTVSSGRAKQQIPDVTGMDATEAANELGQAGFRVRQQKEPSDRVDQGLVTRTDPPGGTPAEKGSTVTLFVSSGPQDVTVPDVVGQQEAAAVASLRDAGFKVSSQDTGDPSVCTVDQDGAVVGQTPRGGASQPAGSTVTITVCRFTP